MAFPFRMHPVVQESFQRLAVKKHFPESFILRHGDKFPFSAILSRQFSKDKTLNALTRNTISITVLQSGSTPNLIPGRAEAILDVRMLPGEDPQAVIKILEQAVAADNIAFEILSAPLPGPVTSFREKPFVLWEDILQQEVPGCLVVPLMDVGGSDSKHFRAKDVPCYGLTPVIIDQDEMSTVHGKNERVSIQNLHLGIRILYRYLLELCNLESPLYSSGAV